MQKIISCCGVVCTECDYYGSECPGCPAIQGKPFWLQYTGEPVCSIYQCCVEHKKLAHCGKCVQLPCSRYEGIDPTKTQEQNQESFAKQLEVLRSL